MSSPTNPPFQQSFVNSITNKLGFTNYHNTAPAPLTPEQLAAANRFGQAIQQMYINHLQSLQTIDTFNKSLQLFLMHSATTNPPEIHALQERVAKAYRLQYIDEITELLTQQNAQIHMQALQPPPPTVIDVTPEWKPGERVIDQFGRTKIGGGEKVALQIGWALFMYVVTSSFMNTKSDAVILLLPVLFFVWLYGATKIWDR